MRKHRDRESNYIPRDGGHQTGDIPAAVAGGEPGGNRTRLARRGGPGRGDDPARSGRGVAPQQPH